MLGKKSKSASVEKISAESVLKLLRWASYPSFAGRIIFRRGPQSCSLYVDKGYIIHAKTNYPEHRIGKILRGLRVVNEEQIRNALKLSRKKGTPLGMALLAGKLIKPRDLYQCLVHQVGLIVKSVADWETGTCYLNPGVTPGEGVVLLRVSLAGILEQMLHRGLHKGVSRLPQATAAQEGEASGGKLQNARTIEEFIRKKEALRSRDYYSLLGIGYSASTDEISRAYRDIIRTYHPDRQTYRLLEDDLKRLNAIFARINTAYTILGNEQKREQYDRREKEAISRSKEQDEISLAGEAQRLYKASLAFMKEGNYPKAAECLKKACQLDPDRAKYFYYLGAAYFKAGKGLKYAEKALLRAIELDGGCPEYYIALGRVYKSGKLMSRAQAMFDQALRWDPKNRTVLEEIRKMKKGGSS